MKILRTASLEANVTGTYKRRVLLANPAGNSSHANLRKTFSP